MTVRDGDSMAGYLGRAASAVRYGRRKDTFSCLAAVDVSLRFGRVWQAFVAGSMGSRCVPSQRA